MPTMWRIRSSVGGVAEIKDHRLEQSRLARLDELRSRNLAIVDHEHSGLDLAFKIAGHERDPMAGAGFVKGPADLGHAFGDGDHRSRSSRPFPGGTAS